MKEINYGKYYTYSELEEVLNMFADEYPETMRLSSLAKTDGGRNIFLVEISENVKSEDTVKKPAYYIQASLHSSEPAGANVCFHFMETLLSQKKDILKDIVFYIVPRVNPDGVESNLVYNGHTRSRNGKNEKIVENYLEMKDMDGDGLILTMRIKNPLGDYKEIAPGVMVSREPGETEGEFYDLYPEGEVVNYNGTPLQDGHRSYDYNRCFPANWTPNFNSTEYPLRDVENRAIAEFLVTHPNIFAGLDYHNGQNGILRPPMCYDSEIDKDDLKLIVSVGEKASETIGFPLIGEFTYGFTRTPVVRHGCTNDFAYRVLGISHYVIELGNGFNDAGLSTLEYLSYPNAEFYYPKIKEYSEKEGYEVFYDFKPFKHPQLGEVEIGGLRGGRGYYQNPKVLKGIVPKTTEFMLNHASMGAVLKIDNCELLSVGGDIYRVRAQIKNTGIFGTKVMKGVSSYQAYYPVHIYIQSDGKTEIISRPNIYEIDKLDSMESTYVEWFIKKPENVKVTVCADHPKAKSCKFTIE